MYVRTREELRQVVVAINRDRAQSGSIPFPLIPGGRDVFL
jgi:hypothetical protein